MAKTVDELPARSLCASKDHEGQRWLLALEFGFNWKKWKLDDGSVVFYVYLHSYCRRCMRLHNRRIKGHTGTQKQKIWSEEQRRKAKRASNKRYYQRVQNSPQLKKELAESRRHRRIAKQGLAESERRMREIEEEL